MKQTKDNAGMTLFALVMTIIVLLILIIVIIIEIDRGIFEHANKYVTEIEESAFEGEELENQFVEEYKEYL